MGSSEYVPTSMSRRLVARMEATHQQRRISVFSGPPGIGKTMAINVLRKRDPKGVGVIKIARQNAKEVLTFKHVLECIRDLSGSTIEHVPTSLWELRKSVYGAVAEWAGADPRTSRKSSFDFSTAPSLTLIFDEAQNLSRQSIESLRYWNDLDLCFSPFPLGLIFVGNSEFSLASDASGQSAISAAVADRALYLETLEYEEITNDDMTLVLRSRGMNDPDAIALLLHSFTTRRSIRSLRRLVDFVGELEAMANGNLASVSDVREALRYV